MTNKIKIYQVDTKCPHCGKRVKFETTDENLVGKPFRCFDCFMSGK